MSDDTSFYTLADAAAWALERQDWASARQLSTLLVQRWPHQLEGHHLLGVTTYYTAAWLGEPVSIPPDHIRLATLFGAVHQEFAKALVKLNAGELADRAFRTAARLDFELQPHLRAGFSGPFNGQVVRMAMFRALVARGVTEVVETGAHRGTTTEFMARIAACPVRTTETHPYFFESTRLRIEDGLRSGDAWARSVHLSALDSRAFLDEMFAQMPETDAVSFFYLDAHCDYIDTDARLDVPLLGELALIRQTRRNCVVMIDDFVVPDDPGYGLEGLTLEGIASALPPYDAIFFPISALHDTGIRRGCIVLSGSPQTTAVLRGIAELRFHSAGGEAPAS